MPTRTRSRGRPRKAASSLSPEMELAEETIDDSPPAPRPRSQKPGPKKVLGELEKAIAGAGATILVKGSEAANGERRGLLAEEAQSISTPLVRIGGRHIPKLFRDVAKQFAPRFNLAEDDMADLSEILVTIGKYALRIVLLTLMEIGQEKEARQAERQAERANVPTPPARKPIPADEMLAFVNEDGQARVGTSSNGHNPVFAAFGPDLGLSE